MTDRLHHPGCESEGLYHKYEVRRTDGTDQPGGRHDGCEYFVLDLTHDPAARDAALAYAARVRPTRPQLAADLVRLVGGLELHAASIHHHHQEQR
jgi:hypothetical protein